MTVGAGTQAPDIAAGRAASGTTVVPANGPPATVAIVQAPSSSAWPDAAGQTPIPVVANGGPAPSEAGPVALAEEGQGTGITLNAAGAVVTYFVGQATGAVVANTGNNRVIDTTSTINVSFDGVPSALLGGTLMINRMVAEAASRR